MKYRPVLLWPSRILSLLAVISGMVLLVVDSPVSLKLQQLRVRPVVEAMPLLLAGLAFLGWIAVDPPGLIDVIKQVFIAVAFILWGIDLLIPSGRWAIFIGAVVIAIYVFDLAWLMEGNFRRKFGRNSAASGSRCPSNDCPPAGVCSSEGRTTH